MNVIFLPRKDRGLDEVNPIYCRITVKGQRVKFSTNLVAKWNSAKRRAIGKNAAIVNEELARIESELIEVWRDMERSGLAYTSKMIYQAYLKKPKNVILWLDTFDAFGNLVEMKIKPHELKEASLVEWGKHRAHLVTKWYIIKASLKSGAFCFDGFTGLCKRVGIFRLERKRSMWCVCVGFGLSCFLGNTWVVFAQKQVIALALALGRQDA